MSVGLEIGTKTIKVVELQKSGEVFRLLGSGAVGYNGHSPDNLSDEKETASLAGVIRKLFSQANISGNDVNISIPESQVFTRTIKFPLLTDSEIASAVKWEAEQYIPGQIEETIIQHQILERRENATPPEVLVLLVAAPRKTVNKYVSLMTAAKLNVIGIETELLATTRSIAPPKQTVAILDIGFKTTSMAIAKNTQLTFTRAIPIGGDTFTRSITQSLGIEYAQAEQYKRTYGFKKEALEGKIGQAMHSPLLSITDEIKKGMHFYATEEGGETPSSVLLTGGSSVIPEIISSLSSLLGKEVSMANPFSRISIDPTVAKTLLPYSPLYAGAVGLALRP